VALEKGTTLAGYEITGILGQGGMGVVYEATQVSLNRTVALKVLAPHLSDDILFRQRFVREGQIQAGIDHQHIVTVYEAGESEHGFFIAMRLIRGPNLKDLIVSRELDPGRTLRILTPISEALDTAHEAGLIHRDIKPQNILVGRRDQAFLADFGLTKASGENSLTKTGQFVGTFDYISPEQIKGEKATKKSDVYSLAAVLYECLTGVVPYPKDSEAAVLYAQMAEDPPKVSDHRPELPATLDDVIARGMAKDPAERYDSAGQVLLEANRTFTRRTRAAFTPPRPIEAPQETGIRPAEVEVPTRQSPAPTEQGALEAETAPADLGETVIGGAAAATAGAAAAEAAEAAPPETAPGVTAPGEAAPPDTSPGVTTPGEAAPPETAPGVTTPGEAPPPETTPGEAAPPETAPGVTTPGAPAESVPGETVHAGAVPDVASPGDSVPGETVHAAAVPDVTVPGKAPEGDETHVTEQLPEAEATRLGEAAPTQLGAAPAAAGATAAGATAAAGAGAAETGSGQIAAPPPPPPPADTARPAARRGPAPVLLAAAAALLIALAVVGYLLGSSGGDSGSEEPATPAGSNLASAGVLELTFPDTWRRADSPPEVPGLTLEDPIALSEKGGSAKNVLAAGLTNATGPAMLPPGLLKRLSGEPPRDDAVKLGDLEAFRYKDLQPTGFDGRLTLYVSPTTQGVATVACTTSAGGGAKFLASCEEIATGLRLTNGDGFALGPDEDFLTDLGDTISRLNAARKDGTTALRKAKKQAQQAKAAQALAADYASARSALSQLEVSPAVAQTSAEIRAALLKTEAAYRALATAARKGRSGAYDKARSAVKSGETALQRALKNVEQS
jgi:serine/threonine kinase PknH